MSDSNAARYKAWLVSIYPSSYDSNSYEIQWDLPTVEPQLLTREQVTTVEHELRNYSGDYVLLVHPPLSTPTIERASEETMIDQLLRRAQERAEAAKQAKLAAEAETAKRLEAKRAKEVLAVEERAELERLRKLHGGGGGCA